MSIVKIKESDVVADKKQASFVAITTELNLWQDYEGASDAARSLRVPLTIFLMRWDGHMGLIGGEVDGGETPLEAARREAKEELGIPALLMDRSLDSWAWVCSHEMEKIVTHLFSWQVDEATFKEILKHQTTAEHFMVEGHAMSVQCIDYEGVPSWSRFKKNQFAPTVREQLAELMVYLGWDTRYGTRMEPEDHASFKAPNTASSSTAASPSKPRGI